MLTEEQQEEQQHRPWQMQQKMSTSSEMKRVAWPPVAPTNEYDNGGGLGRNDVDGTRQYHQDNSNRFSSAGHVSPGPKVAPPVPPKPGAREVVQQSTDSESDNTMASNGTPEPFASNELVGDRSLIAKPAPPPGLILGRPLKKSWGPQESQAVIDSQPIFKRATPVRMLGDMVWPPKGAAGTSDNSQAQSPGPVRRQPKNYQQFFNENQLPANFPTYRAPPGTQHFGLEEGENTTPM